MRDAHNIKEIALLKPDFLGFIFYEPSPRNAIGIDKDIFPTLPDYIEPVGVFVDEDIQTIINTTSYYGIKTIQLHGNETPEFCHSLKEMGYEVLKAIRIPILAGADFFKALEKYEGSINLFVFDTEGKAPGGNGSKFDWDSLENYNLEIPYLLSGGISLQDEDYIIHRLPQRCLGVDINSKFEVSPGLKDSEMIKKFINKIKD